jgi:primosomal protein N' (replication factor Y)
VLYLLPEIALTTQITSRLRKHFGNKLGIYHSKFTDAERVEVWNNMLGNDSFSIILGVRSSIFLPFTSLGLIIIDEEHENSFKQFDPAPRYHARDAAMMLARLHGAKVLLGTATPSIETYHNAVSGRYGLVELFTRHEGIRMPQIIPVDTKEARRKKQMKSLFSPQLVEAINKSVKNGEQVILFQNRRGFAPFVECSQCAWVPKCKHCDVSMTYHKNQNMLVCHYCSYSYQLPDTCHACGSPTLETKGYGTEKIEEETKQVFPDARVARLDLDTARSRKAFEKIIGDFEDHQLDILIGTQMISKGLDFDRVSVVGILNADSMLNFPDFRAFERSFQMLSQVSGRAGRKNKQGLVILQTSDTGHPVVKDVITNNFESHYKQQISERMQFRYPPFFRLINLSVKHKDASTNRKAALMLASALRTVFGERVLGPQEPPVGKIANYFIQRIILKIEKQGSPSKAKQMLLDAVHKINAMPQFRQVIIQIDVDPY